MPHDARTVANVLIQKAIDDGRPLTPLQVIKLVYFCHGWMLGVYSRPLISQEVQAWQYGPVIAEVYHALKDYGGWPVYDLIPGYNTESFDPLEQDLIDQVYQKYGHLNGLELSRLTHAPSTPWDQIWSEQGRNCSIPNDPIKSHYAEKARNAQTAE